jgi:hypothetical protein
VAFRGLQNFLELKFEISGGYDGGVASNEIECEPIRRERAESATAAIPRFASEGAERHEHRRNEREQAREHRPDEDAGNMMKDFPEVIDRGHGTWLRS